MCVTSSQGYAVIAYVSQWCVEGQFIVLLALGMHPNQAGGPRNASKPRS